MAIGREYLHHVTSALGGRHFNLLIFFVTSALGGRHFNLLIFFVTSKCNAKCDFCFYWEQLNRQGDLTVDEIRQISATMPRFQRLLFSGGETFMRKELVEIVKGGGRHAHLVAHHASRFPW